MRGFRVLEFARARSICVWRKPPRPPHSNIRILQNLKPSIGCTLRHRRRSIGCTLSPQLEASKQLNLNQPTGSTHLSGCAATRTLCICWLPHSSRWTMPWPLFRTHHRQGSALSSRKQRKQQMEMTAHRDTNSETSAEGWRRGSQNEWSR